MSDDRQAIAYHVAGRAVMQWSLKRAFPLVTIEPAGGPGGTATQQRPGAWFRPDMEMDDRAQRRIEHDIMVAYAGALADAILAGQLLPSAVPGPAGSEADDIATLALQVCGSYNQTGPYLEWLRAHAFEHLRLPHHWRAVEALAAALLQRGALGWLEARDIMWAAASARPQTPVRPECRLSEVGVAERPGEPAPADAGGSAGAEGGAGEDGSLVIVLPVEDDDEPGAVVVGSGSSPATS